MVLSMERWVGKVAVVTGASSGIGAAIAERLVKEGLQVAALARREDRLAELAKKLSGEKGKLSPIKTDVSNEEEILKAFKWIKENLGPIHILINNAGVGLPNTNAIDGDTELWKKVFGVNVFGLCIATKEAIRDMKANGVDGHIIHVNSILGHQVLNFPGAGIYPSTKYAVTALAEILRMELGREKLKIKITSLSPGLVDTEILEVSKFTENPVYKIIKEEKRILDAEDIAESVVYVLSTPPHVQVAALARRKDRLEELQKKVSNQKGKLHPVVTDISKEEDILTAFKWIKENLGPVHILVNNAGIFPYNQPLCDGDAEAWRKTFEVNVLGLSIATREAVRDMRANNVDGHIIHINSVMGHQVYNYENLSVYPATKFAVRALAETLRLELLSMKSKIKITNISPGLVDTEIITSEARQNPVFKTIMEERLILDSEDIADGVVYALSTPPHVQVQQLTIRPVIEPF
ncbi:farnesol dehydrogenase isoform X2 [Anoplophora glabripennis]|uniref:farnesol dehydrogenase isoform X2 n=1 Tax=Anoplophora glabripennis TaxID=217634 RepID=UPI000C769630|nr:farnesol dehydrogenase isoform X2 [Anoplophora glabripennis]